MPYVHVRDINIYYEERGDPAGPPLIVAHGLMGSIEYERRFGDAAIAMAERGLRVISYDARGHGKSGYTTKRADYHWVSLAEDMHDFIRAIGLEKTSVYGGSMGAGTAIMLALNHPECVDRLVLVLPPPFGEDLRFARRLFGGLSYLYQFLGSSLTSRVVMLSKEAREAQRTNPKNDIRSWIAGQRRASVVPAIRGLLLDPPQIPVERLGEITAHALVLTHPDDPVHPLRSGEIVHGRLPHAQLVVAPETGYWEHSPDLAEFAARFVLGQPVRGPNTLRHAHPAASGTS